MTDDGGPAFPRPQGHNGNVDRQQHTDSHAELGMSLRDWFAGMALQGLLAHREKGGGKLCCMGDDSPQTPGMIFITKGTAERWSKACYDIADAMLKLRTE